MSNQEIRGVWITNRPYSQVLTSKDNITQALDFLQRIGFNAVFPVVWNQGFTLFPSQVMVNHGFLKIDPFFKEKNFDPLKEIVTQAKSRNIAVIPWFEYGFAASKTADGGHILQQKPQWSAQGKIGQKVIHGNCTWMNALNPEVQQFILSLILEVVKNYQVNGIQGDDRFPALPITAGYDTTTKNKFKAQFGKEPPVDETNPQWMQWRADILTDFLAKVFYQVKAINSKLIVSMAPAVYPYCINNLLQDSQTWVKKGIVDFIHPQIYRENFSKYEIEVKKIQSVFTMTDQRAKFAPAIAFNANQTDVSEADILKCIDLNRKSGFQGQIFFHYEGLRKNNDAMAIALKTHSGFNQIAKLPGVSTVSYLSQK